MACAVHAKTKKYKKCKVNVRFPYSSTQTAIREYYGNIRSDPLTHQGNELKCKTSDLNNLVTLYMYMSTCSYLG